MTVDRLPAEAVFFDVDGTLAETERDGHRVAFNRAFEELDLPYRWDTDLYGELVRVAGGFERLEYFLAGQDLSSPGDVTDLARQVHILKSNIYERMVTEDTMQPRPGVIEAIDALQRDDRVTGIVTTGRRQWVEPLLANMLGDRVNNMDVIVVGNDVTELKPHPEAYQLALERAGVQPGQAVAFEDSGNGVKAALAAGIHCIASPSFYTTVDDLREADVIVDEFDDPAVQRVLGTRP